MSARDDLITLMGGLNRSDCCSVCSCGGYNNKTLECVACHAETTQALDAFQTEVLRGAAAKIRADRDEGEAAYPWPDYSDGQTRAADLIDPDVEVW